MNTPSPGRRLAGIAAALLLAGCANMKGIDPEATLKTPPVPGASAGALPAGPKGTANVTIHTPPPPVSRCGSVHSGCLEASASRNHGRSQ